MGTAVGWWHIGGSAGAAAGMRGAGAHRAFFPTQDILAHITKKEFEALLAVDQLNLEREKNKVFLRFSECGDTGTKTVASRVSADLSCATSNTWWTSVLA